MGINVVSSSAIKLLIVPLDVKIVGTGGPKYVEETVLSIRNPCETCLHRASEWCWCIQDGKIHRHKKQIKPPQSLLKKKYTVKVIKMATEMDKEIVTLLERIAELVGAERVIRQERQDIEARVRLITALETCPELTEYL